MASHDLQTGDPSLEILLQDQPTVDTTTDSSLFLLEQSKDSQFAEVIKFLENGILPLYEARTQKVALSRMIICYRGWYFTFYRSQETEQQTSCGANSSEVTVTCRNSSLSDGRTFSW